MSKRIKISVPDSFVESLNELIIRVRERGEEAKKESALRNQSKANEAKKLREERIKKGLKHAEYIFAWGEAFRESEVGQALIRIGHSYVDGVFIFDGQAYQKPWVGIGVGGGGVWWTRSGCGSRENYVQTPQRLAEEVDSEILKLAHGWIKEGKVWECVKNRIDKLIARSKEVQTALARLTSSRGKMEDKIASFGAGI